MNEIIIVLLRQHCNLFLTLFLQPQNQGQANLLSEPSKIAKGRLSLNHFSFLKQDFFYIYILKLDSSLAFYHLQPLSFDFACVPTTMEATISHLGMKEIHESFPGLFFCTVALYICFSFPSLQCCGSWSILDSEQTQTDGARASQSAA